jgi:hypothetical protein
VLSSADVQGAHLQLLCNRVHVVCCGLVVPPAGMTVQKGICSFIVDALSQANQGSCCVAER